MGSVLQKAKQFFIPKARRINVVSKQMAQSQSATNNILFKNYINATPLWYNFEHREQYKLNYYSIPEYNAVKNYKAEAFSAIKFKLKDKNTGEYIESHPVLDLLENPNPFQTKSEFLAQSYLYLEIFGNSYDYKYTLPGFENSGWKYVKALYTLPAEFMYIASNPVSLFKTANTEELINKYYLYYEGLSLDFDKDSILHLNKPNLDFCLEDNSYLYGKPDQLSINWALSNIKAVYEAENVLINNKGALGIISNDTKSDGGYQMPFNSDHKKQLQSDLERYGLKHSKLQYIITNLAMKWTPISFPIKDMNFGETFDRAVSAICNASQFPILILNYLKGASFANLRESKKMLYQDALIPDFERKVNGLNKLLLLKEDGLELEADYSKIAVLQDDQKLKAETEKIKNETLENQYNNGLITRNQWLTELGKEPSNNPLDDLTLTQINQIEQANTQGLGNANVSQEQAEAQANLRGSVGGVQGILAIQAGVASGTTDYDAGIATLIEIYGFSEETAVSVLGTPNVNIENTETNNTEGNDTETE